MVIEQQIIPFMDKKTRDIVLNGKIIHIIGKNKLLIDSLFIISFLFLNLKPFEFLRAGIKNTTFSIINISSSPISFLFGHYLYVLWLVKTYLMAYYQNLQGLHFYHLIF